MTDLAQLVCTTLPSSVRVDEGEGRLPRVSVRSALGAAEVYFQGAHLTVWHPSAAREPVLWRSRESMFEPGRPIRGGVPICFPWFGPHPVDASAPAHGFARLQPWKLVDAREDAAGTVALAMELAGEGVPQWPHRFRVIHRMTFGAVLRMDLEVHNEGADAFTFEEALHTYFSVRDVRTVTVTGLEGAEYLDKVAGSRRSRQGDEALRVTGETDRVYLDTRADCIIHDPQADCVSQDPQAVCVSQDPAARRQISVSKTGSDATVVWNPWIDKSRAMPDFGDDEWPEMLCVETCNVNVHARTLAPGASHTMTAIVAVQEPPD
jgi:glucose-6-phosphate 1-epimerase